MEKTNFSGATYRDLYWKSVYRINNRVGKVPGEKTAQECFDEELRSSAWDVDFGMKIHQTRDKVAMQKIDKTDTLKTILNGRKYTVDYFQREYRWGRKQIEQMLADFQSTFEEFHDPNDTPKEVKKYGFYYMGCIICTGGSVKKIIDGQQRLTSLTLLLIYLNILQKKAFTKEDDRVSLDEMIYSKAFGEKSFNIDVDNRGSCMKALLKEDKNYKPENESTRNMLERYQDIEELFPDDLKEEALPCFITWLIEKVLLLEIDTPSDDEAHTIFLTMNDRGLSLNSAEMMKAYIIQQVAEADRIQVNHMWQDNINRIKSASAYDTSGLVNTQDVEFISTWLRAKYANSMRDNKRGAKDGDYELLGDKFHTWVLQNARSQMNLTKPQDYKDFVLTEMTRVTDIYLQMKKYGSKLTEGYEEVFYNANRDLTYQTMLAIAAIRNDDPEDVVEKKIRMTAKFVDDFATIRIMNSGKVNWKTNRYSLFPVMQNIRNTDCKTIGMIYVRALRRMDVTVEGITKFSLNQFSRRYMLHILARFTSYVNVLMGNPSHFYEEPAHVRPVPVRRDMQGREPVFFPGVRGGASSDERFGGGETRPGRGPVQGGDAIPVRAVSWRAAGEELERRVFLSGAQGGGEQGLTVFTSALADVGSGAQERRDHEGAAETHGEGKRRFGKSPHAPEVGICPAACHFGEREPEQREIVSRDSSHEGCPAPLLRERDAGQGEAQRRARRGRPALCARVRRDKTG